MGKSIKFDFKNSKEVQKWLNGCKARVVNLTRDAVDKLGREMAKKAQEGFDNAIYDGTNDVKVYFLGNVDKSGANQIGGKVIAESPTGNALFIEFGAGVSFGGYNPLRKTANPPILEIGEYGWGQGKKTAWVYKSNSSPRNPTPFYSEKVGSLYRSGKKQQLADPTAQYHWTHGNPPARAMYNASEFGKDYAKLFIKNNLGYMTKRGR